MPSAVILGYLMIGIRKHVREVHNKPVICPNPHCSHAVGQKKDMNRHIEVHHSQRAPRSLYPCDFCGGKFTRRDNLQRHLKKKKCVK